VGSTPAISIAWERGYLGGDFTGNGRGIEERGRQSEHGKSEQNKFLDGQSSEGRILGMKSGRV